MSQGWTWKLLGDVCKTGSGGTPLSSRREFYEGGTIPWLVSGEVAQGNVREAKNFITAAGLENSAARLFPRDTVLVAMYGATAGQVGILRFEATTNQAVCGILPNDKFVPEFLYFFLLAKKDDLVAQATGNAQPNISQIKIKNTEVPVLPLPEQQRIVALLDEAFAGLATAKANAERNLQNARALFESQLESVFSQRGEGWVEKNLGDLCQIKTGKKDVNEGNPEGEFPFFTCAAVHTFSDSYSFDTEALLVAGNGNVGQVSYYSGKFEAYQRTYVLFDFKSVTSNYLFRVLDKRLSAAVSKQKLGNTMPYIKMGMLTDFVVPVPPPEEQEIVAKSLSAIADETQRLTRLYERKLAALEELKKSLLHQAFNGEL